MKKIEIRKNGTKRVYTYNDEPSMTDQSFKEECDVNTIINRYLKTGDESLLKKRQGHYLDVAEVPDLLGAMELVQNANDTFMSLPAQLRKDLQNRPENLITWLQDPKNDKEAIKLGLKVKRQTEEEPTPPLPTPKVDSQEPPPPVKS